MHRILARDVIVMTDFRVDAVAFIAAFAFSTWRFRFAYETSFLSLLLGGVFAIPYLFVGAVFLFLGNPHLLKTWTLLAVIGMGFIAHGCAALLFGKRLATNGKPKQKAARETQEAGPSPEKRGREY